MDEADKITLGFLRQSGCKIGESIHSFKLFDATLLVSSLIVCLHMIDDKYKHQIPSTEMPTSKAKRYNLSMKLSKAMTELGYRREIGYDTFMYPSEQNTREIMRFAVGRLPSQQSMPGRGRSMSTVDGEDDDEEVVGTLETRVRQSLRKWMNCKYSILRKQQTRSPFYTCPIDFPTVPKHDEMSKERVDYCENDLDMVCNQTSHSNWFLPSILSNNHKQYLKEQYRMNKAEYEQDNEEYDIFGDGTGSKVSLNLNQLVAETFKTELLNAKKITKEKYQSLQSGIISTAHQPGKQLSSSKQSTSQPISSQASASSSNLIDQDTRFKSEVKYTQEQTKAGIAVDESGNVFQMTREGNIHLSNQNQSSEEVEEQRRVELEKMRSKIQSLQQRINTIEIQTEKETEHHAEAQTKLESSRETMEQLEKECLTKKKTIDLLPNAEENMKKLEKIVAGSNQRLNQLKNKWNEKKTELMKEFEKKKLEISNQKHKSNDLLLEVKQIRVRMREYGSDIRDKELLVQKLLKKLKKLPKTIDRQVYVDRILGVVQNLESQTQQIRSILEDVKNLQRDTNVIGESSKRIFGVVDDLVFRTASNEKEISAKRQLNQIYRQMVTMREGFDSMVETVQSISNLQNEIRDLEYKSDALKNKVESLEMKQIKTDLKEVEQENEASAQQLKQLRKTLKQLKKNTGK